MLSFTAPVTRESANSGVDVFVSGRYTRQPLATLLNLWKDADSELPLLKKARAEYAKAQ